MAVAVTLLVGAVGLTSAQHIAGRLDDVANSKFPSAAALAEIGPSQAKVARSLNALLLFRMTDPEMRRALYADLERHLEQVEKSSERFGGRRP